MIYESDGLQNIIRRAPGSEKTIRVVLCLLEHVRSGAGPVVEIVMVSAASAALAVSTPTKAPVPTPNAAAVQSPIALRLASNPAAEDITVLCAGDTPRRAAERREGTIGAVKATAEPARHERLRKRERYDIAMASVSLDPEF
jgi:hypothetical protein